MFIRRFLNLAKIREAVGDRPALRAFHFFTEEKNVQEDNSEDSKSKLGDSDCAPWIED
mgnify:CR=1 FL=1